MLRRHHQQHLRGQRQLFVRHRFQRGSKRPRQRFRRARKLVYHGVNPIPGKQRHRRLPRSHAPRHRQRLPRRIGFVFGKTKGVFARRTQYGTVNFAGAAATYIANHQLQGAANGGIGAIALP